MHRHGRHCEEVDARLAGTFADTGTSALWSWRLRAACRHVESAVFFPPDGERPPQRDARETRAKAICGGCPVIGQCAAYAIQYGERYGVWGGLSERERAALARTWPGAGGRMDKQRRPEQQGKRDPVTLPRPDLPIVLLSHHGPVSFGRDESGRTANRGAGGLVGAHRRHCRTSPTPSGYARRHRRGPAVVGEHDHQCSASTWSPSRGSSTRPSPPLRSAWFPPFGCAWSRSTARALACYVEDRAVLGGLVHRMAMGPSRRRDRPAGRAWGAGVPVQSDGRPVGTLDVHATSRGLVGRS